MRTTAILSARQRKARRTLLAAIGFLFTGQFVATLFLDRAPLDLRFPELAQALDRITSRDGSPEILFLGSSRMIAGIRPDQIRDLLQQRTGSAPRVENVSVSGGDPISADYASARLAAIGVRPALVVVDVNPETVSRCGTNMDGNLLRQFTWKEVAECLPQILSTSLFRKFLSSRLNCAYKHRYTLTGWILRSLGPSFRDYEGIEPDAAADAAQQRRDATLSRQEKALLGVQTISRRLKNYRTGGMIGEAFLRLLERSRASGARVLFVGMPLSSPHRALYTPLIERTYLSYLGSLTRAYDARFVDLRDSLPDEAFLDNHHLSSEGASLFSEILVRRALESAWREVRDRGGSANQDDLSTRLRDTSESAAASPRPSS